MMAAAAGGSATVGGVASFATARQDDTPREVS